jgi:hypothetical protein
MTRPTILDLDLVVVPREATMEMQVSGNFNADQSPEAVFSAMLSASPYPTAWDDVRKYVEGLERELAKANNEFGCQTHTWPDLWRRIADLKEYQRKAELRSAELEKRLADAERVIGDFMDITEPASIPAFKDPQYAYEVERLGERIGFGALIASASASWREVAKRNGYPDGGEFVVGPCMAVLQSVRRAARAYMEGKK